MLIRIIVQLYSDIWMDMLWCLNIFHSFCAWMTSIVWNCGAWCACSSSGKRTSSVCITNSNSNIPSLWSWFHLIQCHTNCVINCWHSYSYWWFLVWWAQVIASLKDAMFEPSSALRHATDQLNGILKTTQQTSLSCFYTLVVVLTTGPHLFQHSWL